MLPSAFFIDIIKNQKAKEEKADIWKNSLYKELVGLQSNNVGNIDNVGEIFIQGICDACDITASVDGCKTKEIGGGIGDGLILNQSVEIKNIASLM
jgi:hypothetical protein